jgi:O-methyltransferase
VDWCVEHSHRPSEIMALARAFRTLPAGVMVEAGCFKGGSTAKWSLLCQRYGRTLYVYDSFEGVQGHTVAGDDFDFKGEYAASMGQVKANIRRCGDIRICHFFKGWFADTLAKSAPPNIAIAYIDCDVKEGTEDALRGILPNLVREGVVYTQDYHIDSVRAYLDAPETWQRFAMPAPSITTLAHHTARIAWQG